MPTNLPSADKFSGLESPWIARSVLAGCLAALAALGGVIALYGPYLRAAADAHEARIVAEEDGAFCSSFGAGPGTSRFAECAAALKEIRARHLERRMAETIL